MTVLTILGRNGQYGQNGRNKKCTLEGIGLVPTENEVPSSPTNTDRWG